MMSVDVVSEISVVRSFRVANTICGGGGDGRGAGDILNWSPLKASLEKQLKSAHQCRRPRLKAAVIVINALSLTSLIQDVRESSGVVALALDRDRPSQTVSFVYSLLPPIRP